MATFSKLTLQPAGTTGTGLATLVAATATPGTAIHTASTVSTTIDEVWIYAFNSSASAVKVTIEWGETTAPNGHIEFTVPAENGLYALIPGLPIQGNATARVIRAFAGTASVVTIHGFVNRITA